jgi:hypothetical protein
MIPSDLLLWLGVIGYPLLLLVCAVVGLLAPHDWPAGPRREDRQRVENDGRRTSDCLPVVLFPDGLQEPAILELEGCPCRPFRSRRERFVRPTVS